MAAKSSSEPFAPRPIMLETILPHCSRHSLSENNLRRVTSRTDMLNDFPVGSIR
jgi:hypothetical protein